jgi:hypothetical protein
MLGLISLPKNLQENGNSVHTTNGILTEMEPQEKSTTLSIKLEKYRISGNIG